MESFSGIILRQLVKYRIPSWWKVNFSWVILIQIDWMYDLVTLQKHAAIALILD